MEFLKIIAIFFLVFYGVKYLFRLLMPYALKKMTERLMQKAQQSQATSGQQQYQYNGGGNPFDQFKQQQQTNKGTGEIRVDYVPEEDAQARKGPQTAGEFVDFEEIK